MKPDTRTPEEKYKIDKAYRRKFGHQPFASLGMDPANYAESFDLMEAALESGEPVSKEDRTRMNPPLLGPNVWTI